MQAGAIQQYIGDLLNSMSNKFIVFFFHLDVMRAIQEAVAKAKVKYIRIAGDTPSNIRAVSIEIGDGLTLLWLSLCLNFTLLLAGFGAPVSE